MGKRKKAGIKRGRLRQRKPHLPETKVIDFGLEKITKKINEAIDLIYRRR